MAKLVTDFDGEYPEVPEDKSFLGAFPYSPEVAVLFGDEEPKLADGLVTGFGLISSNRRVLIVDHVDNDGEPTSCCYLDVSEIPNVTELLKALWGVYVTGIELGESKTKDALLEAFSDWINAR
jgi:hypothetical protein